MGTASPRRRWTTRSPGCASSAQADRERIVGLDPRRADVILAGAVILEGDRRGLGGTRGVGERSRDSLGSAARAGRAGAGRGALEPAATSTVFCWACARGCPGSRAWRSRALAGCKGKPATIVSDFQDAFDRTELGADWNATSPAYRLNGGQLEVSRAYNHPAWLRRRLPDDVAIDLDVTSNSPDGDIKVEVFGDGESFDPDKGSYDSTGYVLIFGGWHNSLSVICRQEEHGAGRKAQRADLRVEPGRRYHFAITRRQGAHRLAGRRAPVSFMDGSRTAVRSPPTPISPSTTGKPTSPSTTSASGRRQ